MYQVLLNCLPLCLFVPWTVKEICQLVEAATGFDVTSHELLKVGERALNLAQVFNIREGFRGEQDRLPERSYGPKTSGVLAEGGIDRAELREAIGTYRGMMGWDRRTGVPTVDTLHELGVGWAAAQLTAGA
jgi:aldehyde:ferredoxin oxidoreductase